MTGTVANECAPSLVTGQFPTRWLRSSGNRGERPFVRSLTVAARFGSAGGTLLVFLAAGCTTHKQADTVAQRPEVAPTTAPAPAKTLKLDSAHITPMYTELLAIDLPTVARVAAAQNLDIRRAKQAVLASRGQLESTVGAAFPALVPTALFEHVEGTVRATEGNLVGVGFNTFQPSLAIQWVINPGRVIYDIVAAKKRLLASGHREQAVIQETLRKSATQYYELTLAQARVWAAHQSVMEAEELSRINRLRTRAGAGVPADELRAAARLAQRRQDVVAAMAAFYDASVRLAVTLHLDASATLVPSINELPPTQLVREDLSIEELLGIAASFRPDLEQVRTLLEAVAAERGSTWWGAFGPQFQASYQYAGITGHANNAESAQGLPGNLIVNPLAPSGSFAPGPVTNGLIKEGIARGSRRLDHRGSQTFGFSEQQRGNLGVGWRLSLSAFGNLKTAGALEEEARIQALRQLDEVRAQVVAAAQASRANKELVSLSHQQVDAAQEALRLTEINLRAGSMTTLDVLQAQDAVTQARLRYAQAVVHYNQSQVNLLAALGLLDETSLTAS